jgi:thiamine monophosphate synthase
MRNLYKYYVFVDEIDDNLKKKLIQFININIIIDIDDNTKNSNFYSIVRFSKKNKIKFYIKNNYSLASKYKANGILITSNNKNNLRPLSIKKEFEIIGIVHNQLEYFIKIRQNCHLVMFSPLFDNPKYKKNKTLKTIKFNLISKDWKIKMAALGGIIYNNNLKKIKLLKINSIGFKRFTKE